MLEFLLKMIISRGHGMPDYSSITQVLIVVNLGSNLKVSLGNRMVVVDYGGAIIILDFSSTVFN